MRQNAQLADVFEIQIGLGLKIGESLALTVNQLSLDNELSWWGLM